ncbi:MAG: family 16 glycosylhydrolase [Methylacidiphilales bacterium]|nr:family 16 glycosylhydrolase [Candidatus Methylacidiphilales bacterium]
MKTTAMPGLKNIRIYRKLLAALCLLAALAPFTPIQGQSDINLNGYTQTFAEEFNTPDWTTSNPKGSSVWRSTAPVSGKVIGYTIHDQTCMSCTNGHLINTLKFVPNTDVSGVHCAGPVGMKDGSGTALVTVGTLGSQIHSHSGMAWGAAGWVGMKFTTPSGGLTLSQLGRYNVVGSTGTYDIRIFDATNNGDVAKAIVNLNGQPAGWVYANIVGGNVVLQGSHTYYLMTSTVDGLKNLVDYWYDANTTVTASGGITVNESEWGTWNAGSLFSVDAGFAGFTQQYGYWEARVMMPSSGLGSWPSMSLYTTNQTGNGEEVDVFEDYGNAYDSNVDGGALMRNHNWGTGPTEGSANIEPMAAKPWLNYHIYGFRADPQTCTFYLDGVPKAQFATPIDYLVAPMYMTLEHNIGGGWALTGLVANSEMDVDWVRVWSLPTVAPVITSALTAGGTVGSAFNYQITTNNGATGYNATGLPSGLSVNTLSGLISGTPSAAGTSNVALSASSNIGTGTATLVLTVNPSGGGGASIGIQFVGGQTALNATDSAGLSTVAQTHWNALAGASFGNVALTDNSGSATSTKLTGSANGTYRGGGSSASPAGNAKLASGELFNGWPGAPTLTVSGIPYAQYDVYVYAAIDATGRNETVSLTPSGGSAQFFSFKTQGGGSAWTVATSTWNGTGTPPTLPSANYVHYTGLTAGSFTMAWGAPGNGGLNGIQIVNTSAGGLPSPWTNQDIGSVGVTGSSSYSGGVFTVNGGGADIWNNADSFQYVYQPASGDCSITARVVTQTVTDWWAKAGVMIRSDLTAGSAYAAMLVTPGNGLAYQYRTTAGAGAQNVSGGAGAAPYWVRVTRSGNTFTGYTSPDGTTWTQVGTPLTIAMGTNVYIGLPVCSHNNTTLSTATFDNVTAVP